MKKFSLALMAMVVVLSFTASAMAYEVYVPVRITIEKCAHQQIKTIEYERASDNGGYDVGKSEYHYYNGDVVDCDCDMIVEDEVVYSRYISDTTYKHVFNQASHQFNGFVFELNDGRIEKIVESIGWSPVSFTQF